jgi:hypothetical protein
MRSYDYTIESLIEGKHLAEMENLVGCTLTINTGSLGLCFPRPVVYIRGGAATTVEEFKTNCHFWLTSPDGRIWDYAPSPHNNMEVATYLGFGIGINMKSVNGNVTEIISGIKRLDLRGAAGNGRFFAGETRERLELRGLLYMPAPPAIAAELVAWVTARMRAWVV